MKCKHFEWQLNVPTTVVDASDDDDEPRWYNEQKYRLFLHVYDVQSFGRSFGVCKINVPS